MKKVLMTLAAILCCVMVTTLFTACEKEKDKYEYTIIVQPGGYLTGSQAVLWRNTVMSIYQDQLGTDSENFTKHGTQEECDKEVLEACKKAEMELNSIGGAGEITVYNNTARKMVYRRAM